MKNKKRSESLPVMARPSFFPLITPTPHIRPHPSQAQDDQHVGRGLCFQQGNRYERKSSEPMKEEKENGMPASSFLNPPPSLAFSSPSATRTSAPHTTLTYPPSSTGRSFQGSPASGHGKAEKRGKGGRGEGGRKRPRLTLSQMFLPPFVAPSQAPIQHPLDTPHEAFTDTNPSLIQGLRRVHATPVHRLPRLQPRP